MALITGDVHVTSAPADAYRWEVFPWLRKQAARLNDDILIIAGDLCDKKDKHDARLVNRVVDEFDKFRKAGIRVYEIPGNHDYVDAATPFFRFVRKMGVAYFTEPTRTLVDGIGHVLFLPHDRRALEIWGRLPKELWKKLDLVVMHDTVHGAVFSNGQPADGVLTANWFRTKTRAPIASGDVHVPQVVAGIVNYAGSPHPVHFGDVFSPQVLRFAKGGFVAIPRASIRKHLVTIPIEEVSDWLASKAVREHDQLRLRVELKRSELYLWPEVQARAREKCKERNIVLHAAEPVVLPSKKRPTLKSAAATGGDMAEALAAFCVAQKMDAVLVEAGRKFFDLAAAEAPKPPASCGDWRPGRLSMEGFKTFRNRANIEFPKKPGVWFVSGRNLAQPRLGPNGVGKSTIVDGVSWCLFGRTMRGVRGPSLLNWKEDVPCIVELTWTNDLGAWKCVRTQAPNTLVLSHDGAPGKSVEDADVVAALGFDREQFGFQIAMGQFGRTFFELGDAERLDLFSSALRLNIPERASELAAVREKEAAEAADKTLGEKRRLEGRVSALRDALKAARAAPRPSVDDLMAKRAQLRSGMKEATKLVETLAIAEKAKKEPAAAAVLALQASSAARDALSRAEGSLEAARKAYGALSAALQEKTCPTCRRPMPAGTKPSETVLENAKADGVKAAKEVERLRGDLTAKWAKTEAAEKACDALVRDWNAVLMAVEQKRTSLERLDRELGDLTRARGGWRELVDKARQTLKDAKKGLEIVSEECGRKDAALHVCTTWKREFRRFRYVLIKDALDELAVTANSVVERLGLVRWSLSFEVEKETKTGVSRGFFCNVKAPRAPAAVPLEAWCGGETQRLRVAGVAGLSAFLSSRCGVRAGVEFWDEPTAHLSPEGVGELVDWFGDRARDEGRVLFLIDHRSPDRGGFAGEVRVIKRKVSSEIMPLVPSRGE